MREVSLLFRLAEAAQRHAPKKPQLPRLQSESTEEDAVAAAAENALLAASVARDLSVGELS